MSLLSFPVEWELVNFQDIADVTDFVANGSFASLKENVISKDEVDFAIMVRLKDQTNNWTGPFKYVTENAYNFLSKSNLEPGDLFVANVGAPGRSFIIPNLGQPMTIGPNGLRIRSNDLTSNVFLNYFYSSPQGQEILNEIISGTAQKKFNKTGLRKSLVALPSLAEQKQIADRLGALLAQVDTLKTRLDAIPAILKRFHQSVLAAAVSGKLTNVCIQKMAPVEMIGKVIGGLTKNQNRDKYQNKYKYLRVANVYENKLNLNDILEIGVQNSELDRVLLETGDVLIVEGNGSLDQIGRVALWNSQIENCVHQNHIIKIRVNQTEIHPKFILYYLMSPQGKYNILKKATSGAGLYTLSISKISSIEVPIFDLRIQTEIVRRVDQLFAFADQIEQRVAEAKKRVDHLTQSILAKAFRGDLTAQWRAENPDLISGDHSAEALLARIKAERAEAVASPARKPGRRRNGS